MTLIVCAGVFVFCLLASWRLGVFLKSCDERQEYVIIDLRKASVIVEAEQITREAAES